MGLAQGWHFLSHCHFCVPAKLQVDNLKQPKFLAQVPLQRELHQNCVVGVCLFCLPPFTKLLWHQEDAELIKNTGNESNRCIP